MSTRRKRKPVSVRNQAEADFVRLKWRVDDLVDAVNKIARIQAALQRQVAKLGAFGGLRERLEALSENVENLTGQIQHARKVDRRTRMQAQRDAETREREEAEEAAEADAARERFKVVPHGLEVDGQIVVPPKALYEALRYRPREAELIQDASRELPAVFAYETDEEKAVVTINEDGVMLKGAKGEFAIPFDVVLEAWNASASGSRKHHCRIERA